MNRNAWMGLVMFAAGCAADVDDDGAVEQPQMTSNQMTSNQMTSNAITANAIASNRMSHGPVAPKTWMSGNQIVGEVTDPTLSLSLEDPAAQTFMHYFVECALLPEQRVIWRDHTGAKLQWDGLLGLCPQWQDGYPDLACQERVSACLLARNNAFGVSVPLSLRGTIATGAVLPLSDRASTHDHLLLDTQPVTSAPVPSMRGCATTQYGESRDCGWQAAQIGRCVPGERVSIAAGNLSTCGSGEWLGTGGTGDEVLRVCEGSRGCEFHSKEDLGSSSSGACGGGGPLVEFTCPEGGIYSVLHGSVSSADHPDGVIGSTMMGGHQCAQGGTGCGACIAAVSDIAAYCKTSWDATCEKLTETACRYPATEARVFRWREGSFYGNVFGAANLNPAKPEIFVDPKRFKVGSRIGNDIWLDGGKRSRDFIGVVYPNMYACAARHWRQPDMYMAYRVCAGPDPTDGQYTRNCAAKYVDRCFDACIKHEPNGPGYYDEADCRDHSGRAWATPMTSLLALPCDAVADSGACAVPPMSPPDTDW
jgi:hypothetical protein